MSVVPSLLTQVTSAVATAIGRAHPSLTGADPVVRRSEHADFQSNAALALARQVDARPRDLATSVRDALDPATGTVELSGPGFLNITTPDRTLWEQVAARLADPRLGVDTPETGRRTVIDYSAPNIAKEMHVGHLRTTIIGDSLARVLDFLGADTIRQNHLGDWGTQFGMLIQYLDEHPPAAPAADLDGLYRAARAEFDADPAFADRARARVVALQAGEPSTVARWKDIVARSEQTFQHLYHRLDVLLTPEDSVGESFYNPLLADTLTELVDAGIAVESDGALVVFSEEVDGPDGNPVPLMVRKSDGGYGYDITDLAAIRYRIRDLGADRLLYVTDSRQSLHFRLVFEAARRAGWLGDDVAVEHVGYGMVLGSDGRPFRTRAGGTVRLMGLLDEAVARARAVVAEKAPLLDAAALDAVAEQVGVGAVKYADLSTSRGKDYVFDVERMVSFSGNTGVYLQYAHTRMRSILRKADSPAVVDASLPLLLAERGLALVLDGYGDAVAEVAGSLEPHRLCGYLYELARAFTAFYEACPVLGSTPPSRGNRLALCLLAGRTLEHGLGLLGIGAPSRL
jgi:arginyl-tRNA synthetase